MAYTQHNHAPHYHFWFFVAISVLTVSRIILLMSSPFDLFFDEAQYWFWAQTPDMGYYSKPPVLAWLIAATTHVFGNEEWAVRLASPLCHFFTAIGVYLIARHLFTLPVAVMSGITYLTLPAVTLSSSLISTDAPFLLCWTYALYGFIRSIQHNKIRWWIVAGVFAGLGMLSKYTMIIFLPSAFLFLAFSDRHQYLLRSFGLWSAVVIAFAFFLPNLLWNIDNHFVSFLHTKDNANLEGSLFHPAEMLEFLGAQFGVFGPILFTILLLHLLIFLTGQAHIKERMLCWFILPFFLTILAVSLLSRAHANWAAPMYIAGTLLVTHWMVEKKKHVLLTLSLLLHILLLLLFNHFHFTVHMLGGTLTGRTTEYHNISDWSLRDPFGRLRGNSELGAHVAPLLRQYPDAVLLGENRKILAPLLYYLAKDKHFISIPEFAKWNSDGIFHDHYELVSDMAAFHGRDALLVTRADDVSHITSQFKDVTRLPDSVIPLYIDRTDRYHIFILRYFKGYDA